MDADQHAFDEWAQRRRRRRIWIIVGALIVGSWGVFIASIRLWPRGETVAQVYQDLETQFATRDDQVRELAESTFADGSVEILRADHRDGTRVAFLLNQPLSEAALIRMVQPFVDFEKSTYKYAFKGFVYYDRRAWNLHEELNRERDSSFSRSSLFLNATSAHDWKTVIHGPVPEHSTVGGCVDAFKREANKSDYVHFLGYDRETRECRLALTPPTRVTCMPALILWVIEDFLPGGARGPFLAIPDLITGSVKH